MSVPQKQCVSAVGELKEAAIRTNRVTTEWEPGLCDKEETPFSVDFESMITSKTIRKTAGI